MPVLASPAPAERVHAGGPRFFVPVPLVPGATIVLPREVARHVVVRRLPADSGITLFNGEGGEHAAVIVDLGKTEARVQVREHVAREAELPYAITIAQAISGGDKMDWTVEKCVELGAAAIVPLDAERCVVRLAGERAERRRAHWSAIVGAACEQCGRNRLPAVHPIVPVRDFVARHAAPCRLVATPRADASLIEVLRTLHAPSALTLMIGPEGGFSENEEAAATTAGFTPVSLGPRILRTETAPIAALAMIQAILGAGSAS